MKKKYSLLYHIQQDSSWLTISNFFSFLRIILAPVVATGLYYHQWHFTFFIFLAAALTDLLDGYLARLLKKQTNLGKFLDPLADKFFLLTAFSALAFVDSPSFRIPWWFVMFVLIREGMIVGGSYFIMRTHENPHVEPNIWGKLTTLFQMIFIFWLFLCGFFQWEPAKTYVVSLLFLIIFSLLSLFQYIKKCFGYLYDIIYVK